MLFFSGGIWNISSVENRFSKCIPDVDYSLILLPYGSLLWASNHSLENDNLQVIETICFGLYNRQCLCSFFFLSASQDCSELILESRVSLHDISTDERLKSKSYADNPVLLLCRREMKRLSDAKIEGIYLNTVKC